jgi:hypothetical protein
MIDLLVSYEFFVNKLIDVRSYYRNYSIRLRKNYFMGDTINPLFLLRRRKEYQLPHFVRIRDRSKYRKTRLEQARFRFTIKENKIENSRDAYYLRFDSEDEEDSCCFYNQQKEIKDKKAFLLKRRGG